MSAFVQKARPHVVRLVALALGLITVVALLVRLRSFGDSLFADELSSFYIVAHHGPSTILHLLNGHGIDVNPPLYYLLSWVSEQLFGLSVQSLRLVSLLAGVALIPLTFLLGRRVAGVGVGLVAGLIVALSPFLIFYSTEARAYAFVTVLVLAASLALLTALASGKSAWWIAYGALSCAALYCHYTAIFPLALQAVWAIGTQPNARAKVVVSNLGALVLFVPWLPSFLRDLKSPGSKSIALLEPFNATNIRVDLGRWAIGHPYMTLSHIPGIAALVLASAGVIAAGACIAIRFARARRTARTVRLSVRRWLASDAGLVVVLALAAPVGIAAYSAFQTSIWTARNLIVSWPALAVLLGWLTVARAGRLRVAAVALVIAAYAVGAVTMTEVANQRPNYDAAVALVVRSSSPVAPVVDLVAPTPGPYTATEVAFAVNGTSRPVVRIGLPPIAAVLRAPAYANLPLPSGEALARETAALARTGRLFLIAPSAISTATIRRTRAEHVRAQQGELGEFNSFLGALPPRFRLVAHHTFPGFIPVSVYTFRG